MRLSLLLSGFILVFSLIGYSWWFGQGLEKDKEYVDTYFKSIKRSIASVGEPAILYDGIFEIHGTHKERGAYVGILEIREVEGKFSATRMITYEDFTFQDKKVQEVWIGSAEALHEGIEFQYALKQRDFISQLNGVKRTEQDKDPRVLKENFTLIREDLENESEVVYQGKFLNGGYSETLTPVKGIGETPLYEDGRALVPANSKMRGVEKGYYKTYRTLSRKFYRSDIIKEYKDQKRFKDGIHYWVYDRTDFDFYRENPKIIRVTNKILDAISLTESSIRANAFSQKLYEKAEGFDKDLEIFQMPEHGMIGQTVMNGTKPVELQFNVDSAEWTADYVASQIFRYKVTGEKQALKNAIKSLKALVVLVDIVPDQTTFARTLRFTKLQESDGVGDFNWIKGKGKYAHLDWLSGGNNDMFKGLMYGFIVSWWGLENELSEELKEDIKRVVSRIAKYSEPALKNSENKFTANGVAAAITGDIEFLKAYVNNRSYPTTSFIINHDLPKYVKGISDWSGNQLGMLKHMTWILMTQVLQRKFSGTVLRYNCEYDEMLEKDFCNQKDMNEHLGQDLGKIKNIMFRVWRRLETTRSHMVTMAAATWAGDEFRTHNKSQDYLEDVKWMLREMPYPKLRLNASVDHRMRDEWFPSPFPVLPWKLLAFWEKHEINNYVTGAIGYPFFEMWAFDSSSPYTWKNNPLTFQMSSSSHLSTPGVDFLHAYWMGRFAKIISEVD